MLLLQGLVALALAQFPIREQLIVGDEPRSRCQTLKDQISYETGLRMVADIVMAYLGQSKIERQEVPLLIRDVREALCPELTFSDNALAARLAPNSENGRTGGAEPEARRTSGTTIASPAAVAASISPDYLVSFEDGRQYRSLRRHLMAKHGLTPEQYREKWGLPKDYPMVAPNYAKERSEVAKRIGLGVRKGPGPSRLSNTKR